MLGVTHLSGLGSGGGAFPEVLSRDTSVETGEETSHSVDMPATVDAGDLLVIIFGTEDGSSIAFGTFTEIFDEDSAGAAKLGIAYKQADGTEDGGTETVTTGATTQSAHIVYRITGHVNPATQAPEVSLDANGSSSAPDPNSLTPTGGSKKYLWLAAMACDLDTTAGSISGFPTNYTNGTEINSGSDGAMTGGAERQLKTVSEDPGAFTIHETRFWIAATIAIHPA